MYARYAPYPWRATDARVHANSHSCSRVNMGLHLDREREREQRARHAGVGDGLRVDALGRGDPRACGGDVGAGGRARSYCLSVDDTLVTDARDGTFKKRLEDR